MSKFEPLKNSLCPKRGNKDQPKKKSAVRASLGIFLKKFKFFSKKIQVLNFWFFWFKPKELFIKI